MGIKLIAFDLDGTFLDPKKNISPDNIRALEEAAAKGVVIVPATGRIVGGVPQQIRELPFIRYYVTANGAFCEALTAFTTTSSICCTFTVSMSCWAIATCEYNAQADANAMLTNLFIFFDFLNNEK